MSLPQIDIRCKGQGFALTLHERSSPLATVALWSWLVRGEARDEAFFADVKLQDLTLHHLDPSAPGSLGFKGQASKGSHLVLGRSARPESPYLSLNLKAQMLPAALAAEGVQGRSGATVFLSSKVAIVPIQITLVPSFLVKLSTAVSQGAIVRRIASLPKPPAAPAAPAASSGGGSASAALEGLFQALGRIDGSSSYDGGRVDISFSHKYPPRPRLPPSLSLPLSRFHATGQGQQHQQQGQQQGQ